MDEAEFELRLMAPAELRTEVSTLRTQLKAIQAEVTCWETYAEDQADSHTSMRRIHTLVGTWDASIEASPDPLHPTGRCSCGGEGRCDWCKANPDPYQATDMEAFGATDDPAPDAEGVLEALQSTHAYIESCLDAEESLMAVRDLLKKYNDPNNEMLGSLTTLQRISKLVAVPLAADATEEESNDLYNRLGLDTPAVLQGVVARSSEAWLKAKATEEHTARLAAEAKLKAVQGALDQLIETIELNYCDGEEGAVDGAIDADLIYEDLKGVRALLTAPKAVAPARCDDCDPSFGCFNNPSQCSKRAFDTVGGA